MIDQNISTEYEKDSPKIKKSLSRCKEGAIGVYEATEKQITEQQIREILSERYGGDNDFRKLVSNERRDSHGEIGSIVYSLSGSPPKGYAIYTEGNLTIWFYDSNGVKFAEVNQVVEVVENE